jgi:hypothetical protein
MGEGTVDSAARGEAATEAMFVGSDGGRFESEYQKRRRVVRLLKEIAQETSDMNVKEVEVKVTLRVTRCRPREIEPRDLFGADGKGATCNSDGGREIVDGLRRARCDGQREEW